MTKRPKLANPVGRSTAEWVGRSADDWPPPLAVQLRVLERQDGRCAISGHKFAPGDAKVLDHKVPLADHGQNREGNLQWLWKPAEKQKTAAENSERAKVRRKAMDHHGIKTPPTSPLQSRNDLARGQKEPKRLEKITHGRSAIWRQVRTVKEVEGA